MVDPESMSYRVNTDSPQYRITIPEVITHLRICVPEDLFLETSTHAECDVIVSVKVDLAESGYPWNAANTVIDQINRMRKSQGFS